MKSEIVRARVMCDMYSRNPEKKNRIIRAKQVIAAMIWFDVVSEHSRPIERNSAPLSAAPRYAPATDPASNGGVSALKPSRPRRNSRVGSHISR